jgi:hypothetical protein
MTVMKGNDDEALWTPSRAPTMNTANYGDANPRPSSGNGNVIGVFNN